MPLNKCTQLTFAYPPPIETSNQVAESPTKFAIEMQAIKRMTTQELFSYIGIKQPIDPCESVSEVLTRLESNSHVGYLARVLAEIALRFHDRPLKPAQQYQCSQDIFLHFKSRLEQEKQEYFMVVLLNNKHQYITEVEISKGILNKALVHPREVFSAAISHHSAALICVHNHPSGDPNASKEDIQITRRLGEVGRIVGIPVLDHIIIGKDRYYSLADNGLL